MHAIMTDASCDLDSVYVNEAGLYEVLLLFDHIAKEFSCWMIDSVLPKLRKSRSSPPTATAVDITTTFNRLMEGVDRVCFKLDATAHILSRGHARDVCTSTDEILVDDDNFVVVCP